MFPERLRALRKGEHLTLEGLADAINKDSPTDKEHESTGSQIGNWERGIRTPNYIEIQRLAKFFDVTMDYLTGLTENNTYDIARLFISDKTLQFNGQDLSSADRYEIYQLISGYVHGRSNAPHDKGPRTEQGQLDI